MTSPPDKLRKVPSRRAYAPLKATRPAANEGKSAVSTPQRPAGGDEPVERHPEDGSRS